VGEKVFAQSRQLGHAAWLDSMRGDESTAGGKVVVNMS
jgi:hypothetical protein